MYSFVLNSNTRERIQRRTERDQSLKPRILWLTIRSNVSLLLRRIKLNDNLLSENSYQLIRGCLLCISLILVIYLLNEFY